MSQEQGEMPGELDVKNVHHQVHAEEAYDKCDIPTYLGILQNFAESIIDSLHDELKYHNISTQIEGNRYYHYTMLFFTSFEEFLKDYCPENIQSIIRHEIAGRMSIWMRIMRGTEQERQERLNIARRDIQALPQRINAQSQALNLVFERVLESFEEDKLNVLIQMPKRPLQNLVYYKPLTTGVETVLREMVWNAAKKEYTQRVCVNTSILTEEERASLLEELKTNYGDIDLISNIISNFIEGIKDQQLLLVEVTDNGSPPKKTMAEIVQDAPDVYTRGVNGFGLTEIMRQLNIPVIVEESLEEGYTTRVFTLVPVSMVDRIHKIASVLEEG